MNVSFNGTNPYMPYSAGRTTGAGAGSHSGLSFQYVSGKNAGASLTGYYKGEEVLEDKGKSKAAQVRELLREIQQESARNAYQAVSEDRKNGFLDLTGTKESEEDEMLPENDGIFMVHCGPEGGRLNSTRISLPANCTDACERVAAEASVDVKDLIQFGFGLKKAEEAFKVAVKMRENEIFEALNKLTFKQTV